MSPKTFAFKIDSFFEKDGSVYIHGQWLAGSVSDGERLTLEQDGARLSLVVNRVQLGDDAPELVLVCGKAQDALVVMRVGGRLVGR